MLSPYTLARWRFHAPSPLLDASPVRPYPRERNSPVSECPSHNSSVIPKIISLPCTFLRFLQVPNSDDIDFFNRIGLDGGGRFPLCRNQKNRRRKDGFYSLVLLGSLCWHGFAMDCWLRHDLLRFLR